MRSNRLLAVATGALLLVSACGGDGGTPPDNQAPVASFTEVCTQLSCVFTDASTDSDGTVTARSWNFGDASPASTTTSPTHVYAAAGTYTVVLTVTDNEGATGEFSKQVTVTQETGPVNVPPTSSFDLPASCTAGTPCGFHSTSTDTDGEIVTSVWNYGDGGTGEGTDDTHTYAVAGTYTVTLTVTDDDGATGVSTQQLTVSPAAVQDCTTTGTEVDCELIMTARVTVKFTVLSTDCELTGNRLDVTAPRQQTAFFHLCNRVPGDEYTVLAEGGAPLVFEAGTPLAIRFDQGTTGPADPASGDPGILVDGSFPTWTLRIDDGGNAGAEGEPDFDDAIITVQATAAP